MEAVIWLHIYSLANPSIFSTDQLKLPLSLHNIHCQQNQPIIDCCTISTVLDNICNNLYSNLIYHHYSSLKKSITTVILTTVIGIIFFPFSAFVFPIFSFLFFFFLLFFYICSINHKSIAMCHSVCECMCLCVKYGSITKNIIDWSAMPALSY